VRDHDFHGASRSRLVASDVQRSFTGVRSIGLDLEHVLGRCRAYEPLLRSGEVFSHATAASLHGLPLPEQPDSVHVLAPPATTRARGRDVTGHVSSVAPPSVLHHGLPVVAPAHVWCQLAAELTLYDLVVLGDAIVTGRRRGQVRDAPLATLGALHAAASGWRPRRGTANILAALPRIREGAESRKETHLRLMLMDGGLPEPVPNAPVTLPSGAVLHPDLSYPHLRIAFEYLGDIHRTARRRWQDDLRRRRELAAAGWYVVEVTADDLDSNRTAFLRGVRDVLG
jgi:hypothetical protein